MATIRKAELETINEDLQIEVRTLRSENTHLRSSLASATEQYRQLSERTAKLEQRYRRLLHELLR